MSPLIEVDPKSSWKCPDWTPRNPLVNLRGVVSLQYLLKTAEGGFHTFIYTTPLPNIPHIYIYEGTRDQDSRQNCIQNPIKKIAIGIRMFT